MDEEIKQYSEMVYQALCEIIGDEDLVRFYRLCSKLSISCISIDGFLDNLRKTTGNSSDSLWNALLKLDPTKLLDLHVVDSGSRAEGFVFRSSDIDLMYIMKACKVIHNQSQESQAQLRCILLAENEYTRPGFVRLKLVRIGIPLFLWFCCSVRLDDSYYISNHRITELICTTMNGAGFNVYRHGPCENEIFGEGAGIPEIDMATALQSEIWPEAAVGCIHRLSKCGWPSVDVIKAIVNDCCLFVPVGCKTSPHQEIEWRMSFSLAEKRLVHSMNHTQFLTYALLKLFLKEVINKENESKDLLCSYFMKTLVFWEIIETNIQWIPSNLLQNIWNCFRRLLSWINSEYCPNFFMPENNMFHGKFNVVTKRKLLCFLSMLYRRGYQVFLQIPSIQREFDQCRRVPRQIDSCTLKRSVAIHWLSFYSVTRFNSFTAKVYEALKTSQLKISLEYYHYLRLHKLNILCYKKLCSQHSVGSGNRRKYSNEKLLFNLINASSPDCVRSKIYLAMYLYRCKRNGRCVNILRKVLNKLENMEPIYVWAFDAEKYASLGGDGLSIVEGMQRFTVSWVPLDSETCVPEISDEFSCRAVVGDFHYLPPLVLAYFLLFLCCFYERDLTQARLCIRKLQYYCKYTTKHIAGDGLSISWEILGVCHEIIGDFHHALISFEQSLSFHNAIGFLDGSRRVCEEKITRLKTFLNME